jgi:hypothetical protein
VARERAKLAGAVTEVETRRRGSVKEAKFGEVT